MAVIVQHVANEAFVDLDFIHGELAHVGERRVAGSEIVHGEATPVLAQVGKDIAGVRGIVDETGFGNFQPQAMRRHGRRYRGGDEIDQIGFHEIARRNVDAETKARCPEAGSPQHVRDLRDHPACDLMRQPRMLQHLDETPRGHQSQSGMLPANQRLGRAHLSRPDIQLGLILEEHVARAVAMEVLQQEQIIRIRFEVGAVGHPAAVLFAG